MKSTKITSPVKGYTGDGPGDLKFKDGVAHTTNPAIVNYCRSAGYGIGTATTTPPLSDAETDEAVRRVLSAAERNEFSADELAEIRTTIAELDPAEVRRTLATPPDPRELSDSTIVGTNLRDAAVDPHDDDFLPPTNAGQANPHGPRVVAPQIHAVETQVVRPGPVHVTDLKKQQEAETAQATALLVDRRDAGEALPGYATTDDTGPLGLSDPGSVESTDTGDSADDEQPTNPDGSPAPPTTPEQVERLKGGALDQALEDADLSKTGTVAEKRARLLEHITR